MPFFLYICDMIKLEDYTIKQYAQMLKEQKGEQSDLVKEIDAELSSQLSNFGQGQNIGLFMLQKDMLILFHMCYQKMKKFFEIWLTSIQKNLFENKVFS